MNRDEYSLLFHRLELNRVAFKRLMDCDEEVLKLVNAAIEQEREACALVAEKRFLLDDRGAAQQGHYEACKNIANEIRSRA